MDHSRLKLLAAASAAARCATNDRNGANLAIKPAGVAPAYRAGAVGFGAAAKGCVTPHHRRQNTNSIRPYSATTSAVPAISVDQGLRPIGASHQEQRMLVHGTR
jgi:hypothetical protein